MRAAPSVQRPGLSFQQSAAERDSAAGVGLVEDVDVLCGAIAELSDDYGKAP
jgi:hypothetical protein